jgi:hypothetical protein
MLTCKDASRLISASQERPLGVRERLGLRLHLWMCVNCRRFARQVHWLRRVVRNLAVHAAMDSQGPELRQEVRERIRKAVAERDGPSH